MAKKLVRIPPYAYNEKDFIAEGGFGAVYKGYHEGKPGQVLAIKRTRKGNLTEKEIEILKKLSAPGVRHPNIVALYDIVEKGQDVYLVMEYCNGGDLDHYLKEKRTLDEPTIRVLLQQLTSALMILRKNKILHRDLKPGNILLSCGRNSDITFKIGDFGLGRFLDKEARAQTSCGTMNYMAPELFNPNPKYDYKVDLWSVGVILFECLTGAPYSAFENLPPRFPANTSPELQDLISKLLLKDPKHRINFTDFYSHSFTGMRSTKATKAALAAISSADDDYSLFDHPVLQGMMVKDLQISWADTADTLDSGYEETTSSCVIQ